MKSVSTPINLVFLKSRQRYKKILIMSSHQKD
ncbi:MAG: hypothetical protein ACI97N_001155, partial [Cognaticolwellia sp.]